MRAEETKKGDVITWGGIVATVFTRDPYAHSNKSVLVDIHKEERNHYDIIPLDQEIQLVN